MTEGVRNVHTIDASTGQEDLQVVDGRVPGEAESALALAYAAKIAPSLPTDKILLVNLSGRGDKDMQTVAEESGLKL